MNSPLFINNKYTKWYNNIIEAAKSRPKPDCYTGKHHIIPKSFGGSNKPKNLVVLTAREHFICHWLLTKMVEGKYKRNMMCAWHFSFTGNSKNKKTQTH